MLFEDKVTILKYLNSRGFQVSYSWYSIERIPLHRRGAVLDLDCPGRNKILWKINKEKAFGMHTEWLLLNRVQKESDQHLNGQIFMSEAVISVAESYALPGSCVKLLQLIDDVEKLYYFDMYRVTIREPMQFQLDWSGSKKLPLPEIVPRCEYRKRSNFGGITMKSASIIKFPDFFKGFESLDYREVDTWAKMHFPMMVLLTEQLNFIQNITITDLYGWETNGSFDGLMGLLQREEIDFGATGFFMRKDRMKVSDFSAETFYVRTAITFKQPTLSSVSNIFVLPFSKLVWIAGASLTLLVAVILASEYFLTKKISIYPYKEKHAATADLITMVMSTVCQQGTELNPISLPSRITVFLFSLFAFFLYTSYSANIVALLQSSAPVIKTINDLTKSHLKFKVQNDIYNEIYFKEAVDKAIIDLYKVKVKPQGKEAYCSPDIGVKYMRTGTYAYDGETNLIYKFISDTFEEDEKCSLSEMDLFYLPALAVPVVKRSGHREHLTRMMSWQREVGMFSRIKSVWLAPKPQCGSNGSGFVNVGLADFLPALLVFVYGAAVTTGLFILEILFHYRNKLRWRNSICGGKIVVTDLRTNAEIGWTVKQ
ncbi:ionotropic receptor 75d isoform X2 [Rhodnius prolixus]|uniref:ionotropic receptor 75d isoform X2 n=1 Tax=Rhodnius prolixus TaxID=13249 RepID=UPI003D18C0BD